MTIYPASASEITSIIGPDQTDTHFYPVPITNRTSRDFGPILANLHLEDLYQDCVPVRDVVPILHQTVTFAYESEELKKNWGKISSRRI